MGEPELTSEQYRYWVMFWDLYPLPDSTYSEIKSYCDLTGYSMNVEEIELIKRMNHTAQKEVYKKWQT